MKYIPEINFDKIQDIYLKRNFQNLFTYFKTQNQMLDFKHFDLNFDGPVENFKVAHGLNSAPQDIYVTKVTGNGIVKYNHGLFDDKNIDLSTTGPCRVRFFAGSYWDSKPSQDNDSKSSVSEYFSTRSASSGRDFKNIENVSLYQMLTSDDVLLCYPKESGLTVKLPPVAECAGRTYLLEKNDRTTHLVNIVVSDGYIDYKENKITRLTVFLEKVEIYSTGTYWIVLDRTFFGGSGVPGGTGGSGTPPTTGGTATMSFVDFISSGTFTCPAGVISAWVEIIPAGGGGGGGGETGGGGGGGAGGEGGVAMVIPLAFVPLASYAITVGAGGVGGPKGLGAGANGTAGAQGGDTIVFHKDGSVTIKGGRGGNPGLGSGVGGTAPGGGLHDGLIYTNGGFGTADNVVAGDGERSIYTTGGTAGNNAGPGWAGNGGGGGAGFSIALETGIGGAGGSGQGTNNGQPGNNYGSGGGGAGGGRTGSYVAGNGGNGAGGFVRIWIIQAA